MSRIPVISRESPGHQQAREQRNQLNEVIRQVVASWWDHHDDPLMVEVLRGLALAQSLDDAHPINRQGRCRRWGCTQRWWFPFIRRQCSTRATLNFCRSADTVTLWFHVLNQLPSVNMSLTTVRAWLEGCHTNKPQTNQPETQPDTGK